MVDLNSMTIFVRVVEMSSFSQAARQLDIPKATVSRKVAELETDLGTPLLHRTTRKLYLTEAGNIYFQRCRHILDEVEDANRAITSLQDIPQGTLRITAPIVFGTCFLSQWIADFLQQYEQIRVEVLLTNQLIDLVSENIDIAFSWQTQPLASSSLDTQSLYRVSYWLCASPSYLEQYGKPKTPQELSHHRCIRVCSQPFASHTTWQLIDPTGRIETVNVMGRLVSNDLILARQAAISGSGIAYLPNSLLGEPIKLGQLDRVLTDWAFREGTLCLRRLNLSPLSAKVRAFCDFVAEKCLKTNEPDLSYTQAKDRTVNG
ncbi:LysR family transcriptional regulator [Pseudanabaena sp. FACHB-2040]|uniref:LysR family transcriptional regulator n=1 Tax=Pseudanabaena sp. FACHB-2040 TaxID=2692859 RepID=UPI001684755B|nr:LysR family transcriptional regulator [Pseudanabaena sp. FACHB-2040]MBD2259306.1 LysR family transcriptional regulator [Pseudanabaena sp. FACHB-2040]